MTFQKTAGLATKFLTDRSPVILTAVGATGTVTTAVLAYRAGVKAERLVRDYDENLDVPGLWPDLELRDRIERSWTLYIPPVVSGVVTVGAIVMANRIGSHRAAAMASAYMLSTKAFDEYKDKVVEKIGENKARGIHDDIAQDRMNANPVTDHKVIMATGGNQLCFEPFTGRYFYSDMETLKKAQNDLNYQVNNSYHASLSDFYDLIGLDHTSISDDFGWNSDELMEIIFSSVLSSSGQPCLSFEYKVVPTKNYYRVQ